MTQEEFVAQIRNSIFYALRTAAPMIPGATPERLEWYRRVLKVSEIGITAAQEEALKRMPVEVDGLEKRRKSS